MTALVEQQALAAALARVRGAVETRSSIPILSHLLIEAAGAGSATMDLIATDLDIEVSATLEAAIETPLRCTTQADLLIDIVKRVPKGAQIRLVLEEHGDLRLRWGRNSASLRTLPADDYPRLLPPEGPDAPVMIAMPLETLSGALAFCVPAISSEETQYYLNGVYLHPAPEGASGDPGTLRAVATDGHRLARADTALPWPQGWPEKGGILPRKPVGMLTDADGDAQIGLTERLLRIETEGWALTAKMIDGTFPDYNRVIPVPEPSAQRFTLDRGALAEAVQIGLVPSRADRKTAAIRMTPEDGGITLSAHSPDHGSATIPLDGTVSPGADGAGWPVGFNGRYLADLLTVLNNGEVTFTQNGSAGEPALITQPESARALVLMPMRV